MVRAKEHDLESLRAQIKSSEEGGGMDKPVSNATELKPIVEKAVKALYGEAMQNIKILKADRFPLFKEPKQGWLIHTEFNDDRYEYSIQMDVQMADGRVTRAVELHRAPTKK